MLRQVTDAASPELIVRRLIDEGFSQGRLEVCDELISSELVEHQDFGPDHASGAEGAKAVIVSLRRAFSDFELHIDDLVDAYLFAFERRLSGVYNAGFENLTVLEIAQTITREVPDPPRSARSFT